MECLVRTGSGSPFPLAGRQGRR